MLNRDGEKIWTPPQTLSISWGLSLGEGRLSITLRTTFLLEGYIGWTLEQWRIIVPQEQIRSHTVVLASADHGAGLVINEDSPLFRFTHQIFVPLDDSLGLIRNDELPEIT